MLRARERSVGGIGVVGKGERVVGEPGGWAWFVCVCGGAR